MDARATASDEPLGDGNVLAVCLGPGGIPKQPVAAARVEELGLVGDAHRFPSHGGPRRAVCLFSAEDYRSLARDGVPCAEPGTFGENLLVEGIDFGRLRAGDRLRVGDEVVLEIADVRAPCGTLKRVDRRFPELMVGRSGFVCRVERAGVVAPGQRVAVCDQKVSAD
jgi:TatD DNase family protein